MSEKLKRETLIWRPVMAKIVSMEEIKKGYVTLVDLQKINAWLDMKSDIEIDAYERSKNGRT